MLFDHSQSLKVGRFNVNLIHGSASAGDVDHSNVGGSRKLPPQDLEGHVSD